MNIDVQIEICSKCQSHQAYTRHVEQNYNDIAADIVKIIKSKDSDVNIQINKVGEYKIGAFQIICNGRVVFSKLKLGYFPDVFAVTQRLLTYISEIRQGINNSFLTKSRLSQSQSRGFQYMTNRSSSTANFTRSQMEKQKTNRSNPKTRDSDRKQQNNKNPQNNNNLGKSRTQKFYQTFKQKKAKLIQQYKKKYPHRDTDKLFVGQKPEPANVIYAAKPYPQNVQQMGYQKQTASWQKKRKEKKQQNSNISNINISQSIINNKGTNIATTETKVEKTEKEVKSTQPIKQKEKIST